MQVRPFFGWSIIVGLIFGGPVLGVWAGQDPNGHGEDFQVGVSASGQLRALFDEDEAFFLPPVNGLLQGWAAGEPGFISVEENEPDEGLFLLDPDANIVVEVLAIDPALFMRGAGFAPIPAGGQFVVGMPPFDVHPEAWHIDSTDPAFDGRQTIWNATLRLIDTRPDGHAPSEPFTRAFTNVEPVEDGPEPVPVASGRGMLVLTVVLAGLLALRFGWSGPPKGGKPV